MSVKVVNSGGGEVKITVETIPSISVTSPEVGVIDINPNYTTGQPGPTGAQGPTGATGAGVEEGGSENQFLQKNSATDYDTKWSAYTLPAADGENAQVLVTDGAGALTFDHVRSIRITIRNDEGATIPAGTPIYSRGEIGGSERILVGIADASDPAKMPAIGIAETTLTTAGDTKDGYAIMSGVFNTNVSGFTGLSEGDILYVSNSGGGLIQTKPTGTYLIQNVGIVLKTNGTILQGFQVACIGRTNDVPNIPEDYFWIGNSSGVATPTDFDTRVASAPAVVANTAKPDGTDLSVSTTSDNVTVISDTGTNATITEATASQAGVMTVTMHDKLDAIAANADVTNSTNVDAAGAIMHSDIAANGFIRRTGAETYDQITPGTGLSVSSSNLIVSGNTTLAAVNDTDNVILKVTGPSGTQDAGVTLTPSDRLTIEPVGNTVTFTVDNDLANYSNTTSQFIKYANLSSTGTVVSGISLTYNNSTGAFDLSGPISLTSGDIPDLSSTYHQDLSIGDTTATQLRVDITNGDNVVLPAATSTEAGLLTAANKLIVDKAITDDDFSTNGILRRTAAQTYDANGSLNELANVTIANPANGHLLIGDASGNFSNQALSLTRITASSTGQNLTLAADEYTGGTGINVDGSQVISVDTHTTIDTATAGSNATITVQGPSGQADSITLAAGSNVTITEAGDQITIASDNDNTQLSNEQVQDIVGDMFASNTETLITATYQDVDGTIDLVVDNDLSNYDNTNSGFLTGSSTTNSLTDVSSSGSADGQILIYDTGTNSYDPATLTEGSNITITEGPGSITIAATDTGISNVQADSSPSLGGNLNVNDFHIVSDASEHITIEAGSGGDVNIDGEPVNIKHAGTTRLATSGTGVTITGHVDMADDDEIRLGTDNDFRIKYDSANDDGELRAASIALKGSNDEFMLLAQENGVVSLYYDNARKFDTTSYGVSVSGHAAALGYITNLSTALSAVGNHSGATLVEQVYSSGTVTIGKVYYMGSSAWAEGHADTEASAKGMLAVATSAAANGRFVTRGLVKVLDIKGTTPSKGDIVYLSEEATESGYVTVDRPSADGDIVRIVGYVVDNSNDMIYFDPSPDFIEVA